MVELGISYGSNTKPPEPGRHHFGRLLRLIEDLRQSTFEPLVRLAKTFHHWREALVTMWRFTRNNASPRASTAK